MNGRMYDPQMGRFLSPDNFVQDPFNTQSYNRYGYVMNNPLIYSDPNGEFAETAVAAYWIGAVVVASIASSWNWLNDQGVFRGVNKWFNKSIKGPIDKAFDWLHGRNKKDAPNAAVESAPASVSIDPLIRPGFGVVPILTGNGNGGASSSLANGPLRDGTMKGLVSHPAQRSGAEWFANKKDAYNYAMNESKITDNIEREVSGFALDNGEYLVLDPSDNTRTKSFNDQLKSRVVNGKREIRFQDKWYGLKGHFHTHPGGKNSFDPIGVSSSDLKLMNGALNNIQMSILHTGNEWLLSPGNQYLNPNINIGYNLKNIGSWK